VISKLTAIELCAGAGGEALGLEQAGFNHLALVEIDAYACATLRLNRPEWNVIEGDIKSFSAFQYEGVDLLAGGMPCPPFSIAGKQLGDKDERNLFPEALRLIKQCNPKAIMLENVKGLLSPTFKHYRESFTNEIKALGYVGQWKLLNASDFGVSQLRPRALFVALKKDFADNFAWPQPFSDAPPTVGELLYPEMSSNGWGKAGEWRLKANQIAPTLVGGSKKHGGPDLGPTRARLAWAALGVDGGSLAFEPPSPDFEGLPRLTVKMTALLQGFPLEWKFSGKKTQAYRQVGNAFPPPVAKEMGEAIRRAITNAELPTINVIETPEKQERVA
jgi:DNA (cytosine-5)-methyltransferase 1